MEHCFDVITSAGDSTAAASQLHMFSCFVSFFLISDPKTLLCRLELLAMFAQCSHTRRRYHAGPLFIFFSCPSLLSRVHHLFDRP